MPVIIECDSCGRRVKVKEEYAGRRIRCPGCEEPILVPAGDDEFEVDYEEEEFERRPSARSRGQKPTSGKKRSRQKPQTEKSWFRRNWHWVAVLVMLLFALWPKVGLVIAMLISAVGVGMVLIGGIYPFLRVIFGAPGTVLLMILSRQARFDMMRQPDNHPYKVLVRTAFDPTRGLFWKGVLLMVMFLPAAVINTNIPEFYKRLGPEPQIAQPNPNVFPGRPQGQPGGPGPNPGQPGFVPQGDPHQNPIGRNQGGFPPQGRPPGDRGGNNIFSFTVTYQEFRGTGTVEEAAKAALNIHSGLVEDSVKIDEEAKTIQFQHKGQIAPGALAKLFGSRGFASLSIQSNNK